MPSTDDPLAVSTDLDPAALQPVLRHAVVVGVLAALLAVVAVLPGAGRGLPGTTVTVGGLATATVAAGVVATLLYASRSVKRLVRAQLDGPTPVVDDLAASASYAAGFVAVLVAHWGLARVVVPVLPAGRAWMYDVALLGIALFVLLAPTYRLVRNADALAGHLARTLHDARGADEAVERPPSGDGTGQGWAK